MEQERLAAFEAEVDSLRIAHRIPGLSLAVVRDGRVVIARGYGFADLEAGRPATERTPYPIASVTKPIAGVVAMRLVERGVLDLDRPLARYENWAEFCSEVREQGPPIFFRDYSCDPAATLRHMLSMQMNGVPGARFYYNPISFSWASRPMMQTTGRSFSELVAEEVFVPAGMTESARTHRGLPLRPEVAEAMALPYHVDSVGSFVRSPPLRPQGDGAAGGVISTVLDMARFDLALDDGRLLAPGSKNEMWRAGRSASGDVLPYGIGWFIEQIGERRTVWHTGLWDGAYSALYLKLPDERLSLILLANAEGLRWEKPLNAAGLAGSPFAMAFLHRFPGR